MALTWASNLLARGDEDARELVRDWKSAELPALTDPQDAQRTLHWLMQRSVRRLDESAKRALMAAGLLAPAPFPLAAIEAALNTEVISGLSVRSALRDLVRSNVLRLAREQNHWQFTHVLAYRFARQQAGSDIALRKRLGQWLAGYLRGLLSPAAAEALPAETRRALEHCHALLREDADQALWETLANPLLYEFSNRLTSLGRLGQVELATSAVDAWFELFPVEKATLPDWLRERGVSRNRVGDVLLAQGDLARAGRAYEEALEVSRGLAKSDPSNADCQRDLSVSLDRVGDVLRAQGDLARAGSAYEEALEVSRGLAKSDPSNADWQRDVSVSLDKVGDVLRAQGDLAGAGRAYEEALEVSRGLAKSDPGNADCQRDVSVSLDKVGNVLLAQGDLAGAGRAYEEALEVSRGLAKSDSSNAGWQRDVSVSLDKVGDVLRAQGDLAGAGSAYEESLEVRRGLAKSDPSNAGWQRDWSIALTRLAEIHEKRGDLGSAIEAAEESLKIDERLAALDPTNAVWQKDVRVSRFLVERLRRAR